MFEAHGGALANAEHGTKGLVLAHAERTAADSAVVHRKDEIACRERDISQTVYARAVRDYQV